MPKLTLVEKILRELEYIPTPPCDKGCHWKAYCRIKEVACPNFSAFIREEERKLEGRDKPWPKDSPRPNLKLGEDDV
jgi:hypothetical protein